MKKVILNPAFEHLRPYLQSIPENFDNSGTLLEARRNILRQDTVENVKLIIKSYKRIYLTNRIRYSFFYPSKAQRAFDNGNLLLQKGFDSPMPIAYIEVKHFGLITESYFISQYIDFKPLHHKEVLNAVNKDSLIEELARFTFLLHQNKIYHKDYTLGNILCKGSGTYFQLALVDNNRMKFGSVSLSKGIRSLVRMELPEADIVEIAKVYCKLRNADEAVAPVKFYSYKKLIERRHRVKQYLKGIMSALKYACLCLIVNEGVISELVLFDNL